MFLLCGIVTSIHAQKKDYFWGYVMLSEGDTLKGWVKDRSSGPFMELYPRIRFKAENSLFRKKFGPDEIVAYSVNAQRYESVPLREDPAFFRFDYHINEGNDRVFLRVVSRNKDLTYYHWEFMDADSHFIDHIPLFYRSGSFEMVRVTQGILGLKRNKLATYFSDCPDLVNAIRTKELNGIYEVYDFYLDHCKDP